ncbi:hypothetical protein H5410_037619, partial [Solanum commersonii]
YILNQEQNRNMDDYGTLKSKETGSSCWLLCLSHAKDFMANFGENQKEKIFFTQASTLQKPKLP